MRGGKNVSSPSEIESKIQVLSKRYEKGDAPTAHELRAAWEAVCETVEFCKKLEEEVSRLKAVVDRIERSR